MSAAFELTGKATRVHQRAAKAHFLAGGAVLVSEHGHEHTRPVTTSTTVHTAETTTWDELVSDVRDWRHRYPNQRFYVVEMTS